MVPKLEILHFMCRVVGERSVCGEIEPEGLVERTEVRMPV